MLKNDRSRWFKVGILFGGLASLVACGGETSELTGEGLPEGRMTFIIPYGPGGSTDNVSRIFAEHLGEELDRQIDIQNIDGGGGSVGMSRTVESEPDGLTIGAGSNTAFTFQPLINDGLPWETTEDYTAFGLASDSPALLVSSKNTDIQSIEDLVTEGTARPGEIAVGTTGAGTLSHIASAQLEEQLGIDLNVVHFPSAADATAAVLGGHVELFIGTPSSAAGQVAAGEVNGVAVLSDFVPEGLDVSSIVDQGYEPTITSQLYVIAPPDLPGGVEEELEQAVSTVLQSDAYQEALAGEGARVGPTSIDATEEALTSQAELMERLVQVMDL